MASAGAPTPAVNDRETLFSRIITSFARWSTRWVPDAMVFVLALSVVVFFLAWGLTPHGPVQLVDDWVKGFWVLLTFAMQMSLLMITGFAVADSKYVKVLLKRLVALPKTRAQTILMYAFVISVFWYIHWGLGMMLAIVLGREIVLTKRGLGIHYPLLAATAYIAIEVANGPSMAPQLLVATPGHFMEKVVGVIPLSQTTFDIHLIVMNIIIFLTVPFIIWAMMPKKEHSLEASDEIVASFQEAEADAVRESKESLTPAERWDRSPVLPIIVAIAGLFWVVKFFTTKGIANLDLNTLNFTFFMLGLILHGTPKSFIASVQKGTATVYGVIIQFPLYAGIFGMISYSGLAEIIAKWFVAISTPDTYPWIVFIYSGILNFFVPSGGSKFVIEAPYILPAAKELGANIAYTINAYTCGDLWTNVLQPFWALPILGAFRLKFRDILPYGVVIWLWTGIVISIALLFFPRWF